MGNGLLKTIDLLGNALVQFEVVIEQLNQRVAELEAQLAASDENAKDRPE